MSENTIARYLSPLAKGQTVKIRGTEGLGIPASVRNMVATVLAVQTDAPQTVEQVIAGEPADVATETTIFTPVQVALPNGLTMWFGRGQLSAVSSKLA
jgi:hypothetical protein